MKKTPVSAKVYIFLGVFLIALPTLLNLYNGHMGRFLVSRPSIAEGKISPFQKTVVYVFRHKLSGAFGLIVNRPVEKAELEKYFPGQVFRVPVYYGGPVEYPSRLFLVGESRETGEVEIYPDPFGGDKTHMDMAYLQSLDWFDNQRIFAGFSGWMLWQLNHEIAKGNWDVVDYDPLLLFSDDVEKLWGEARKRVLESKPVEKDQPVS